MMSSQDFADIMIFRFRFRKATETVFSFLLLSCCKILNLLFLEALLLVTNSDIFSAECTIGMV